MFIDETEITVSSGRGGDGTVSFRREKYVPRGGPDGGDGGQGGDVILRASLHMNTLAGIQHKHHYRAEAGRPGGPRQRQGASGQDLVLEVPVGTQVRDAERGHVLRDLTAEGEQVRVVRGGKGGHGNKHFAHATNQTPRRSTQGQPGETRRLRLELRLVADVGLVGLPNAGKSTFLRATTAARPKVADYPFTTLQPVLGLLARDDSGLVLADIPGLIEGAHAGAGLGHRFLRHIQRTRLLLHLVDAQRGPEGAVDAWRTINAELDQVDLGLGGRPTVLALSRADTVAEPEAAARALEEASGAPVTILSAATGRGVDAVVARLHAELNRLEQETRGKT